MILNPFPQTKTGDLWKDTNGAATKFAVEILQPITNHMTIKHDNNILNISSEIFLRGFPRIFAEYIVLCDQAINVWLHF